MRQFIDLLESHYSIDKENRLLELFPEQGSISLKELRDKVLNGESPGFFTTPDTLLTSLSNLLLSKKIKRVKYGVYARTANLTEKP